MKTTNTEFTEYTVYDFAWEEADDAPLDECAVHIVFAASPSDAVDVVSGLAEHGPDDEMFSNYLPADEAPSVPADRDQ